MSGAIPLLPLHAFYGVYGDKFAFLERQTKPTDTIRLINNNNNNNIIIIIIIISSSSSSSSSNHNNCGCSSVQCFNTAHCCGLMPVFCNNINSFKVACVVKT